MGFSNAFPLVENLAVSMRETVQSLDWKVPWRRDMGTPAVSSWRIQWTERSPGGLQFTVSQRVRHN